MKRIVVIIFLVFALAGFSQDKKKVAKVEQEEKQIFRTGNDFYKQQNYVDAEVYYKKSLKQNPNYEKANYNLGNAIYQQNRFKEALPMYELVSKTTEDKLTKAESFHNIGNTMMKEKQYDKAVEAFKNSMRNNSKDDETRYNLALAQKMLKKQQDQNKDNKDKNKDKDKDKKDKDKKDKDDKKDQNKDKDKDKKGDDKDKNKDKKKDDKGDKDKQKPEPKPQQPKLSPQQIKQLLEAMNNEENKTQKKVNAKKAKGRKVKQEKDW